MPRLAAAPPLLALGIVVRLGRFDDVTGRRLGRIARVLLGLRQLRFQLGNARVEPRTLWTSCPAIPLCHDVRSLLDGPPQGKAKAAGLQVTVQKYRESLHQGFRRY
jgi:hypothetical protein